MSQSPPNPAVAGRPSQSGSTKSPSVKRGTHLSGYSLLARAEPQIWFTGGMLVVCLVMIVGLLTFILFAGLPTFWPRQVHWLVLNDGSLEVGQFQVAESVQDEKEVSRYYRTGNFDLTGQHYRWLPATQLIDSGISQPPWAMVVERLENGRLYGLLNQLSIAVDIGVPARQEISRYHEVQESLAGIASIDSELRDTVTAALSQQQTRTLSRALRASIGNAQSTRGLMQVQLEQSPSWVSFPDVPADAILVGARLVLTDEAQVHQQLQLELKRAAKLGSQAEHLRYQISRLDARLSELHAQVRRAELATDTQVAQPVESSHFLLEQLEALSLRREAIESNRLLLEQFAGTQPWSERALAALTEYATNGLPEELKSLDEQLQTWLAPIAEQPAAVVDAVKEYQAGYRQIVADKRPLQQQLHELQEQLKLAEVTFVVPFAPQALAVQASDIEQLRAGQVSDALQQVLREQSIEVQLKEIKVDQLSQRLALVSILDQAQQRHVLAIAAGAETGANAGSDDVAAGDVAAGDAAAGDAAAGVAGTAQVVLLQSKAVNVEQIVRAFPANQLSGWDKLSVYGDRWREFLLENPREANTEGGVFPAIWGTIVMTLIMTIAVVPFGVMAALYLREYTKSGPLVSMIRISINNLAGVPSIVYGVFGFSFFCYTIGAFVDGGAKNADIQPWPPAIWFMVLGAVSAIGTIAFFCSFTSGGPSHAQTGFKRIAARMALVLWLVSVAVVGVLVLKSPFFEGFYREYLPNPTFGKGGLLWAALTLSLLTLPVVIVATEEALAAVPNSLREGSLACGASKWQTIYRIILPHARPGILTGAILAMARGAGEVAPLMLVGALASAPDLPLDGEFPFFHGSRSFMHLGYQIYTLGFQSQNSEAAKPMVFTCTLLLILIVAALNISAIYLRSRLKRQFQGSQF
jgi:ABC-type phosphate transport system permease subunit